MTYIDGFVLRVPQNRIDDYRAIAEKAGNIWREYGALDYKECVLEDGEDKGYCKTFPVAFAAQPGETIVFAFITFASKAQRDEVNAKVHADPRLQEMCDPNDLPFDCKNMAYGGFQTIVE